jgi:D-3-phosphoglycerate dehydrogenase
VDEDALVEALHDGRLGGAGPDVFATEPFLIRSALRTLPNVVLTPVTVSCTLAAPHPCNPCSISRSFRNAAQPT